MYSRLALNLGQVDAEEADDGVLIGDGEHLEHEETLAERVVEPAPLHREYEGRHEGLRWLRRV